VFLLPRDMPPDQVRPSPWKWTSPFSNILSTYE
jgi:hypothetical protein